MYEPVLTENPSQINNYWNQELNINNNHLESASSRKPRTFQRTLSLRDYFSDDSNQTMKHSAGDCYVDVNHIHVGLTTKELSYVNAAVQTTHLMPYRLRFWPKTDCNNLNPSPSQNSCGLKCKCCCQIFSQYLLSQAGLTIVVLCWALIGAYAFYITEGPRELNQSYTLAQIQKNLSESLALDLNQSIGHEDVWPAIIHKYFEKHEFLFLEAVGAGFGEGGGGNIWTYPGCILFSTSLLTTLGFGAPVPRTPLGRTAAVIFALIGIPLHFLLVMNVGNLTAIRIQQFALKTRSNDIPFSSKQPKWLKWFPFIAIIIYYLLGVALFGFGRRRDPLHAFMFPLDFTASGGVATVLGIIRIFYAIYLEFAVTLAAMVLSLIQASAGKGLVDIGLKWGLLTNT